MFRDLKNRSKDEEYESNEQVRGGANSDIIYCLLCPNERDQSGSAMFCRSCYQTYYMRPWIVQSTKIEFYGALKGDPLVTYYCPTLMKSVSDYKEGKQIDDLYKYKRSLYLLYLVFSYDSLCKLFCKFTVYVHFR